MRGLRFGCLVGVVIGWAGCGLEGDTGGSWEGTVDTLESGRVVVRNGGTGSWTPSEAGRVERLARIGAVEGNGPDVFGAVIALELDKAGRVYAIDRQAQDVRIFDEDGRHVRTIGNEGEGPGEFTGANGLGWGPDGNLWVVDQRLRRFSVFDTSGTFLDSHQAPMAIRSFAWEGWFTREGRIIDRGFLQTDTDSRSTYMPFDPGVGYTDTLLLPEVTPEYFSWRNESGGGTAQIPFSAQPVLAISPGGHLWMSDARDYTIHQTTWAGDTVLTIERLASPIPVSPDERAEAVERIDGFMRGNPYDAGRIPGVKPPLRRIYVAEDGNIWVLRPDSAGAPGTTLDVFESSGRYLGEVVTTHPMERWPRFVIRDDRLAYVTTDDLDVQYVIVSRIRGLTVSDTP